jgi:hypothetical protein
MAYKRISSGIMGSSEGEAITGAERLWYLHNALKGERPLVVMEEDTFQPDILPYSCMRGNKSSTRQFYTTRGEVLNFTVKALGRTPCWRVD